MNYKKAVEQIAQNRKMREVSAQTAWEELVKSDARLYALECKANDAFLKSLSGGGDADYQIALAEKEAYVRSLKLDKQVYYPAAECKECGDTGLVAGRPCRCAVRLATRTASENSLPPFKLSDFKAEDEKDADLYKFLTAFIDKFPDTAKKNLLFLGSAGTGKTFAASILANELAERGHTVAAISAFAFLTRALKFHTTFDESKNEYLQPLIDSDLLVIDDLGTESILKNVTLEYLYIVLSERMNAGRTTVITSNLDRDGLEKRYGERIASRLFHKTLCYAKQFCGVDKRKL